MLMLSIHIMFILNKEFTNDIFDIFKAAYFQCDFVVSKCCTLEIP